MVDYSSMTEIEKELVLFADQILTKADQMPVFKDDPKTDTRIHVQWIDDLPVLAHFQTVEGLLPHDYRTFLNDFIVNLNHVSPKAATYTQIEHDSPYLTFIVSIDLGIPFVSARTVPVVAYHSTIGDEEFFTVTTKGCEHLVEKHMDKIGRDAVIPGCEINFFRFSPQVDNEGNVCGTKIV